MKATLKDLILGGSDLDGYTYQADTWCVECGREIIKVSLLEVLMNLAECDTVLQPIFFGEAVTSQYCADCGERIPKQ